MTECNSNVCFKVGYAHGRKKEVILVAKKGSEMQFDSQAINLIFYEYINELKEKLTVRLRKSE